jgi:hypothetical protein
LDTGWDLDSSCSNSVVNTAEPTDNAPQGVRHRRHLQSRWWTLPEPPAMPPRAPAIDVVFNLGGGHCRTRWQHPQRAHHQRHLQPRWWMISDPLAAPPRGPCHQRRLQNSVPDAVGPTGSAPRGPTIDIILNLGGGCRQTHWQRPLGGPP